MLVSPVDGSLDLPWCVLAVVGMLNLIIMAAIESQFEINEATTFCKDIPTTQPKNIFLLQEYIS